MLEIQSGIAIQDEATLLLPPSHAHHESQRLTQEALAGLQFVLVELEFVAPEYGRDDKSEFHLEDMLVSSSLLNEAEICELTSATLRPTQDRGPYENGMKAPFCL